MSSQAVDGAITIEASLGNLLAAKVWIVTTRALLRLLWSADRMVRYMAPCEEFARNWIAIGGLIRICGISPICCRFRLVSCLPQATALDHPIFFCCSRERSSRNVLR